jgi:hypothetical protein
VVHKMTQAGPIFAQPLTPEGCAAILRSGISRALEA